MRIQVQYFAMCREIAGRDAEHIELPEGATGADFWEHIGARYPAMHGHRKESRLAVNMSYEDEHTVLKDGDEVCIIPPVSGG